MSKQVLALLAKVIEKDVAGDSWQKTSQNFRKSNLDYKKHEVEEYSEQDIENELRKQILLFDKERNTSKTAKPQTDYYSLIEAQNGFAEAARVYVKTLDASWTKEELEAAKSRPGIKAVANNYDGLNKRRIAPADKAAKEVLFRILKDQNTYFLNDYRLLSPDHSLPVADIRFSRALYNAVSKKNPSAASAGDIVEGGKAVLNQLMDARYRGRQLISPETHDYFIESFSTVASRFTSGLSSKEFDITVGAKIAPRSQLDNEEVGGKLVEGYMAELAAAAKDIVGKSDWVGTESSDSYTQAVMKQLNNACVKAGATGKMQALKTAPNSATQKSQRKITEKVKKVKLGTKDKSPRAAKIKPSKPQFSLQRIVDYINRKLPPEVRSNMNDGTLVNRTGRFSNSARIVEVTNTAQGYPSFSYTYQRSPYDVFDPTLGALPWNTPGRNPKALIEKSVRDIVRDMAIGRFYLRRV